MPAITTLRKSQERKSSLSRPRFLLRERQAVPVQTLAVDVVLVNGRMNHVVYLEEGVEISCRRNLVSLDANHKAPEFVLECSRQVHPGHGRRRGSCEPPDAIVFPRRRLASERVAEGIG